MASLRMLTSVQMLLGSFHYLVTSVKAKNHLLAQECYFSDVVYLSRDARDKPRDANT